MTAAEDNMAGLSIEDEEDDGVQIDLEESDAPFSLTRCFVGTFLTYGIHRGASQSQTWVEDDIFFGLTMKSMQTESRKMVLGVLTPICWFFTDFYGPPEVDNRLDSWQLLRHLMIVHISLGVWSGTSTKFSLYSETGRIDGLITEDETFHDEDEDIRMMRAVMKAIVCTNSGMISAVSPPMNEAGVRLLSRLNDEMNGVESDRQGLGYVMTENLEDEGNDGGLILLALCEQNTRRASGLALSRYEERVFRICLSHRDIGRRRQIRSFDTRRVSGHDRDGVQLLLEIHDRMRKELKAIDEEWDTCHRDIGRRRQIRSFDTRRVSGHDRRSLIKAGDDSLLCSIAKSRSQPINAFSDIETELRALVHYATSKRTPQQNFGEISVTYNVLRNRSPCNFLVFGLGYDSRMWNALNPHGKTLFLEEDQKWVDNVLKGEPDIRAYAVNYRTQLKEAGDLLKHYRTEPSCFPSNAYLSGNDRCKLALTGFPNEFYGTGWDFDNDRRAAWVFRGGAGKVEKLFATEFLCKKYLVKSVGRLWHFQIPPADKTTIHDDKIQEEHPDWPWSRCMKKEFPDMPKAIATSVVAARFGASIQGASPATTADGVQLLLEIHDRMRKELKAIDEEWDTW
ncbi:zinc finger family protein [Hibiscus syriacus]|uniref:Zinc finger family protein n=1 Tax=Hibiscus syriacus TaxID=106335 RepID=A0A6A3BRR5_HIBSY|nr:zinc finger family protein [Hibiscus syriacus]